MKRTSFDSKSLVTNGAHKAGIYTTKIFKASTILVPLFQGRHLGYRILPIIISARKYLKKNLNVKRFDAKSRLYTKY